MPTNRLKNDGGFGDAEAQVDDLIAQAIPMSGLALEELKDIVAEADVVVGLDTRTGNQSLFWGETAMKRVIASGEAEPAAFAVLSFDFRTDDLERLVAVCEATKGGCDYEGSKYFPSEN
jgi:hypothetical protein